MRSYVTGARGFLGRHLLPRLSALGETEVLEGDIFDPDALAGAGRADVVYHLAAQASPVEAERDPAATSRLNVEGTLRVAAGTRPRARLVFASTAHVYAPSNTPVAEDAPTAPASAYAASKLAAEDALRALAPHGPQPVVLRLFNVYGPDQSEAYVIGRLLAAIRRGESPRLGAPDPVRDFIHVDDVVEALILAGTRPLNAPVVVNVGTGVGTSIRDLAAAAGAEPTFEWRPSTAGPSYLVADTRKAEAVLGWKARTPLGEGLARCLTRR